MSENRVVSDIFQLSITLSGPHMSELEQNQEVAECICRDFAWQGRQFNRGDCVVLLDGEIVAVESDMDHAPKSLRQVEPDTQRVMLVEVRNPVVEVIRRKAGRARFTSKAQTIATSWKCNWSIGTDE